MPPARTGVRTNFMITVLSLNLTYKCKTENTRMPIENRTARLTVLIDPRKKAILERLCAEEDATPSQVVRRLIRDYIERRTGRAWHPDDDPAESATSKTSSTRSTHARAR